MAGGPRVCIVGAGAAGLSAAWYLDRRGYRNVVVLEAADRVGGKCHSFTHQDCCVDLGAFTATLDYRYVLEIARAVGAPLGPQPRRLAVRWDTSPPRVTSILAALRENHSLWQLAMTALRYLRALWHYRSFVGPPGFAGVGADGRFPELSLPFGEWARQRGMAPLIELFRVPVTDMGYGHVADVPAAYVLKYMDLLNVTTIALYVLGIGFGWPKRFLEGYGRLWTRVSWRLDVRMSATITRIDRGDEVTVAWTERRRTDDGTVVDVEREERFDHLILASPLNESKAFLRWSDEERRLYDRIRYNAYFVTMCVARGMPTETIDAMHDLEPGHPWEIMRPWADADVGVFYTSGESHLTPEQILQNIRADVARVFPAAEIGRVLHQKGWQYFPHVSREALADGYYDALEALQGKQRTYLAGGVMAFETVENVVQYSHGLVQRFFPPL